MSSPVVAAGTRIYISTSVPATNTASAFAALSWTKIVGVRVLGDLGNNWGLRDEALIESDDVIKKKTLLSQKSLAIQVINLVDDAGQIILRDKSGVNENVSIKIERKDGGLRYFEGAISSYEESQGGDGKKVFDAICNIEPQKKVVFV